jgi:hypothetical protein
MKILSRHLTVLNRQTKRSVLYHCHFYKAMDRQRSFTTHHTVENWGLDSCRSNGSPVIYNVLTESLSPLVFYPVNNEHAFHGIKRRRSVKLITHFHLVPRSGTQGTLFPRPTYIFKVYEDTNYYRLNITDSDYFMLNLQMF